MKWWLFLVFGVVGCAGYFAGPPGLVSESVFVGIGLISVSAVIAGMWIYRPASIRAWGLVAAGSALWVAGDAMYLYISQSQGTVPVPSPADYIYLIGYPVLAAGLYLLVHEGWRRGDLGHVANSTIVMIAFGLILWVFVVQPNAVDVSTAAGLLSVAYPAMDIFLLGLLVHFVSATQWQSTAFRLLTAAVVLVLAADTAYELATVTVAGHNIADAGYLGYNILVGTAALHPSMRRLSAPTPRSSVSTIAASYNLPTVLIVTAAALTAPAVSAIMLIRGEPVRNWGWAVVLTATILVCLIFVRVSELLRLLQRQTRTLRNVADTDHLTGLLNRRGLERWIDVNDAYRRPLAFLLLDIDRFKDINDTFGHRVGDDVVRAVAHRVTRAVGLRGVVARVGTDEFLIATTTFPFEAEDIAHDVHHTLRRPVTTADATLFVEVSIGISTSAEPPAETLGQQAYLAMESAKTVQPRTAVYDSSMARDNSAQLLLLSELTTAIDQHHLELYYQLQVDLTAMEAIGVEALLRWNHPVRGLIEPDSFLPMAERTGLIRPLLDFVLTQTAAQHLEWRREGIDLALSINVSTRNLLDTTLVEQVRRALDAGLDPRMLTIEITETSSMTDPPVAIETLAELRRLGVTLAIDDYGTGYSSLAYLQRLPVQQLKIDKTFVLDMMAVPAHRVIVRSTIDLARTLGLTITAEGVEDRDTLLELKALCCNYAQGYYVGRPVPADEIPASVTKLNAELKEYTDTP